MAKSYVIREHVWGELGTTRGPCSFDFEAGTRAPEDAGEEAVLDYLVSIGRANLAAEPPAKKKGA